MPDPRLGGAELAAEDLLHWRHWWFLECAGYLDLRARIQGPATADGRTVVLTAPRVPRREVVAGDVVPRLLALARDHRDDDVAAAALRALGRLVGATRDVDAPPTPLAEVLGVLTDRLHAANHAVAESAALALGLTGRVEAVPPLIALLGRDAVASRELPRPSTRLRCFAAYGLALAAERIGDPVVRQHIALELAEALLAAGTESDDLEVALLTAFGICGLSERPLVPSPALRERPAIESVLSRSGQVALLDRWLTPARKGQASDVVRGHACVAAARLAGEASLGLRRAITEQLTALAQDRAEGLSLRAAAAFALGSVACAGDHPADRAARRALTLLARKGQPLERRMALIGAARAASRPGLGAEPFEGATELRRALTAELARGHGFDRPWVALALGVLDEGLVASGEDPGSATAEVLLAASERRRSVDDTAAIGLALALATRDTHEAIRAGERVAAVLPLVADQGARSHLFVAAGILGHAPLAAVLREAARTSDAQPLLLWSAAVGLALLGEPVARELTPRLAEARTSSARAAVAAALGNTTGHDAVGALVALLDDRQATSTTLCAAADALGALCDDARWPWRHTFAHGLPYFLMTPSLVTDGQGLLELPW